MSSNLNKTECSLWWHRVKHFEYTKLYFSGNKKKCTYITKEKPSRKINFMQAAHVFHLNSGQ